MKFDFRIFLFDNFIRKKRTYFYYAIYLNLVLSTSICYVCCMSVKREVSYDLNKPYYVIPLRSSYAAQPSI